MSILKCIGCDTPIPDGKFKCPMCGAQVVPKQLDISLSSHQPSAQILIPPTINDGIVCPKCHTKNAIVVNKQGFGLGKAAIGIFCLGPLGLLGGMIGSNSLNITCLACNHKWQPGQSAPITVIDNSVPFSWKRVGLMIFLGAGAMLLFLYSIRDFLRK